MLLSAFALEIAWGDAGQFVNISTVHPVRDCLQKTHCITAQQGLHHSVTTLPHFWLRYHQSKDMQAFWHCKMVGFLVVWLGFFCLQFKCRQMVVPKEAVLITEAWIST